MVKMAPVERAGQFHMRLSGEEDRMLRAVADAEGLSASDFLRQAIRRAFIERFGDKKPKTKK
jgi:uncharacterized protein (DUF1778 family)